MHVRNHMWNRSRRSISSSGRPHGAWSTTARALWAMLGAYLLYRGMRSVGQHRQRAADREAKETNLDQTLAESFPASDPPSTIPDPGPRGD